MGEEHVKILKTKAANHRFMRSVLNDLKAFEIMQKENLFESDTIRIGAEQEMCIVDDKMKPANVAPAILEQMQDKSWITSELAQFNLEINLSPRVFRGSCLREMEQENRSYLQQIREVVNPHGGEIILTGVLPTLRKWDLDLSNLFPAERYYALMEALSRQRGKKNNFELKLSGIDELLISHDSPLLEACNTSFQVHLQVRPNDFVPMYNIAQAITGPMIAISANSPLVFGKRLWHESRIALFQQAIDTRTVNYHMREKSPRVIFGNGWLQNSILEIYQEDIARFRSLLYTTYHENSLETLAKGKIPKLKALQIHNGTVYRWNRPCYGISDNGMPHLRIENRVFAAGPSVTDEIANAAFWLGCMQGMHDKYPDIREHIEFVDIRDNFSKAARYGIDSQFTWLNNEKISASELILRELLPNAHHGLNLMGVDKNDIQHYLGVIEARASAQMTGARWALISYSHLIKHTDREESLAILTKAIKNNQNNDLQVHEWPLPQKNDMIEYSGINQRVDESMTTDFLTARKDDLIHLVAKMMIWKDVSQIPVEDKDGQVVGTVDRLEMLKYFLESENTKKSTSISDIMHSDPPTIAPHKTVKEALHRMMHENHNYLLVVKNKELMGLITKEDILRITNRYFERK